MISDLDNHYYIYEHREPETFETVYIGRGSLGRAWDVSRNRQSHPEHQQWMYDLTQQGYTPDAWVRLLECNLSYDNAVEREKEHLQAGLYRFNRQRGEKNNKAKLTDEQAREIFSSNESNKILMERYHVSNTCISHIRHRKQWRAVTACLVK